VILKVNKIDHYFKNNFRRVFLALGSNGETILDAREENLVDKVGLSCKLLEANDT
jgi:hypothetical protein